MELHEFTIKLPKRDKVAIIPTGDWHIGSIASSIDKLRDLIKWIKKTPHVYILGMGDYVDAINLSDKRFDPDSLTIEYRNKMGRLVQEQTDEAIDILKPVRDRIIGLGIGNHESYVGRHYHFDIMYRLCGVLNVKYLGWSAITRLRISRITGDHNSSHIINIFS